MIVFLLNGVVSALLASVWVYSAGYSIWAAVLAYPLGGFAGMALTVTLHLFSQQDRATQGYLARAPHR